MISVVLLIVIALFIKHQYDSMNEKFDEAKAIDDEMYGIGV